MVSDISSALARLVLGLYPTAMIQLFSVRCCDIFHFLFPSSLGYLFFCVYQPAHKYKVVKPDLSSFSLHEIITYARQFAEESRLHRPGLAFCSQLPFTSHHNI